MVQMIVVTSHQSLVPVLFYIPHGSDNTAIASMGGKGQIVFISHMVQIIHAATIIVGNNGKVLYIPHGSDNTKAPLPSDLV